MSDYWSNLLEYACVRKMNIKFIPPLRNNEHGWFDIGDKVWLIQSMGTYGGIQVAQAINHNRDKLVLFSNDGKNWRRDIKDD